MSRVEFSNDRNELGLFAKKMAIVVLIAAVAYALFQLRHVIVLIYIAAILTLWSMFAYLRNAWPSLRRDLKRKASNP